MTRLTFLDFAYDATRGLLHADGSTAHVSPQTAQLLLYLVDRGGQMVTKDELLRALWPAGGASEYALTGAIRRLRDVLGDDARHPRYLLTEHRVGFRWIAPVSRDLVTAAAAPHGRRCEGLRGRAAELDQIDEALAEAITGRARLVVIEGPRGIGKRVLADAFLEGVPPSVGTLRCQCLNLRTTPEPYGPLLDALDRFVRLEPATHVDKLRHFAPSWLTQMPWLDADHARGTTLTEGSTGRMLRELVRFAEELTRTPGVLVVDDLHWADPATVDAIATLVERLDRSPLLIVATRRSPAPEKFEPSLDATIADLEHRDLCVRVALQPLGVRSVS